jgi:hypothetical protein
MIEYFKTLNAKLNLDSVLEFKLDVNHDHLNIIHFIFVSCVRFSERF